MMATAVEPSSEVQNGPPRMENSDLKQVDRPSSSSQEDLFDQMLSGIAWEEVNRGSVKPPWEPAGADGGGGSDSDGQKIFGLSSAWGEQWTSAEELQYLASHGEPGVMPSELQELGIIGGGSSTPSEIPRDFQRSNDYEQQCMLLPATAKSVATGDLGFLPLPPSHGGSGSADSRLLAGRSRDDDADLCFRSPNPSVRFSTIPTIFPSSFHSCKSSVALSSSTMASADPFSKKSRRPRGFIRFLQPLLLFHGWTAEAGIGRLVSHH